jgi:hypothetical protein
LFARSTRDRRPSAGLRPGNLVTELGGTPVRDAADLQIRELAVWRPRGTLTVRAEMAERGK